MKTVVAVFLVLSVFLGGCSVSNFEKEKQNWEAQDWSFYETFGTQVPDAQMLAHFSGKTASKLTAYSNDGTQRNQKDYDQVSEYYLIVTMGDSAGRTYAMIFKKSKTEPSQALQTTTRSSLTSTIFSRCDSSRYSVQIASDL